MVHAAAVGQNIIYHQAEQSQRSADRRDFGVVKYFFNLLILCKCSFVFETKSKTFDSKLGIVFAYFTLIII